MKKLRKRMKWPECLVLIRHARSFFNELKEALEKDPLWQVFVEAYKTDFRSEKTKDLANLLRATYNNSYGDRKTPLTEYGRRVQAPKTGAYLKTQIELPDVILVSPHLRCLETLEGLKEGWPELGKVKTYEDERMVERRVGTCQLYTHWKIFHVFHPEQKELYEKDGYYDYQYPQGDSMIDVNDRIKNLFGTIIREFHGKKVFCVGHGVTIMGFRTAQERLTKEQFMELDHKNPPKNCSITIYRGDPKLGKNGRLVLERYNETAP